MPEDTRGAAVLSEVQETMLGPLMENALFRIGPWRMLGGIFALGGALIVAILVGQPTAAVAPPSELPLAPLPRGATTARAALSGQPSPASALVELSVASTPTVEAAPPLPALTASSPAAKPPDDPRATERERQRAAIEGRLGDTRQSIESFIGPPATHLLGQEFLYRAPTRFTITYSHSNRAALFTIWSPRDPGRHPLAADPRDWTSAQAREVAGLFIPLDAQPLQARKGFLGQPEDLYFSQALGNAIGRADYVLAAAKGPPGAFGVLFTTTEAGRISAVTVGLR